MRVKTVVLVAALLAAACGSQPGDIIASGSTTATPQTTVGPIEPTEPTGVEAEFAAAHARWDAAGLDTYSYRFLDDCGECDQLPVQSAVVWEGEVLDPLRRVSSIEGAFALIERALAQGTDVEVTFDRELGYPTDLWIDREARAYDGGIHLMFSAVEPGLPGGPASLEDHRNARIRWEQAGLTSYEYSSAVVCDCDYQVSMHTTVVDGRVTEFDARTPEPTNITFSPLTIAQMFDDVEAFLSGEDFPDEGISVTGSALYDAEYGYPMWIGLEIEVTDPQVAAEAGLPPRLVMTVSDLVPLTVDAGSDLVAARATWETAGLADYTFDIVFHDIGDADFTETFTVTVERGVIVGVIQNGYEYPPEDVEIPTIDEVFETLVNWQMAGRVFDAIYDVELGYPSVVITNEPEGSLSISLHR
ncbi:MAG: DUF6174 domain-containing protein [Acidimicrobiia bacterium]|nr:DUF6174 domain-containing protein [Acidimicrobiia bacterium]